MRTYLSAGLLLLTLGAIAQTQPGSVADAAKSGNQAKKSRRVITNDDIPSRPEPAPETVGAPMTKQEATTPAAASEEKAKPEPEKSVPVQDSEAIKAAQKKVDDLKARLETVQQQIQETDKKIDSSTDDQVRDALKAARDGKKEFAVELNKEISEADKELQAARSASSKPAESAPGAGETAPPSKQ